MNNKERLKERIRKNKEKVKSFKKGDLIEFGLCENISFFNADEHTPGFKPESSDLEGKIVEVIDNGFAMVETKYGVLKTELQYAKRKGE